jgi:hypothetical protein
MQIKLSPEDWETFMNALENPPKPNRKLIALMRGETYIAPGIAPHKYDAEEGSGIGFCKICFTDDGDHPIHIKD